MFNSLKKLLVGEAGLPDEPLQPPIPTPPVRRFRVLYPMNAWINGKPQSYKAGGVYNVRPGNDDLAGYVQDWVEAGWAEWVRGSERPHQTARMAPQASAGQATGNARVK